MKHLCSPENKSDCFRSERAMRRCAALWTLLVVIFATPALAFANTITTYSFEGGAIALDVHRGSYDPNAFRLFADGLSFTADYDHTVQSLTVHLPQAVGSVRWFPSEATGHGYDDLLTNDPVHFESTDLQYTNIKGYADPTGQNPFHGFVGRSPLDTPGHDADMVTSMMTVETNYLYNGQHPAVFSPLGNWFVSGAGLTPEEVAKLGTYLLNVALDLDRGGFGLVGFFGIDGPFAFSPQNGGYTVHGMFSASTLVGSHTFTTGESVPEPATALLFAAGSFVAVRRRRIMPR